MAENPFNRLAPFIQDFIYREHWDELRRVQVETINAVFDTPNHILIMSPTASGKTEAAFLPALTELYNDPPATIGVVYIGPLKALINDQFERLQYLLEETGIPVQSWHGDVSRSKKKKFIQKAQGVLQITPESLEAMLIHRHVELPRLFGDLRFVIIDEVHAFIDSDRGRQVICQLGRLARYQAKPPRRIGLSATIGEPELAKRWLAGGTAVPVTLVKDTRQGDVMLGLEYFPDLPNDFEKLLKKAQETQIGEKIAALENLVLEHRAMFQHLYTLTRRTKSIVFVNSRTDTEEIISNLRRLAEKNKTPDIYHVHHGSISTPLREAAETAMKEPDHPACISATVTLELGIDVGQLDQVLQVNATHSVSSFVQRLGRSGRRGNAAQMFFYSRETIPDDEASLGQRIPWNLLQAIAIVQLYLEEKWIEPPRIPLLPLSLLYHQTMSCVFACTELTPPELAERVLTLPPFQHISQDHYRDLLRHLLAIDHLEQTEIGGLIIGLSAEKIVNNYRFYATFEDNTVYQVREGSREIGTIQDAPPVGERIALAGYTWEVTDVQKEKRIIFVKRIRGRASARWTGSGGELHKRILQRMRNALQEDQHYGYLLDRAVQRLTEARLLARQSGLAKRAILPMGGNRFMILPWEGTRVSNTLMMLLDHQGIKVSKGFAPFYCEIDAPNAELDELRISLRAIAGNPPAAETLIADLPYENLIQNKYDRFVPETLLREAMVRDYLDVDGALKAIETFVR